MDILILFVIVFWFADPKWMGRYLSQVQYWKQYYTANGDDEFYRQVVRARAKNIKRIRHEKFKNLG